ncbi:MAG: hypothetical protein ABWK00_05800 [Desulfurococcaceae archaeon]
MSDLFSVYAALVKNLRGVVLLDPEEDGALESLEWLSRRFRYRNLGVPPSLLRKHAEGLSKYLGGRPFRALAYPLRALEQLAGELSAGLNLDEEVAELLVLSSIYVSPAILIGNNYLGEAKSLSISSVETCRELSLSEWKLHMRIADYTILDMYEWSVSSALKALEELRTGHVPSEILSERRRAVERDKKRYWRISCSGGRPFLLYVDVLDAAIKGAPGFLANAPDDCAAALSIVPVIHVPPSMRT